MSNEQPLTSEPTKLSAGEVRAGLHGLLASGLAWGGLQFYPTADVKWFARGAAGIASLLAGSPVERIDAGWLLGGASQPVVVSEACSATGYFLTVVALLGWRLAQRGFSPVVAVPAALVGGFVFTLFVNALRVVALMHAHHWVIPRFPDSYAPFLHLLTGVAVFLPALIALNLLLEFYGNRRHFPR
jgi:exosortase/archaeosortase family protein